MKKTLTALLLLAATPAFAHPGHELLQPLQEGLLHPLTGTDHLLMLLGTGLLAALTSRRVHMPLAALAMLALGAGFGQVFGAFVGMETLIWAAVPVLGVALWLQRQAVPMFVMPLLALAHGWAHGVEASSGAFTTFCLGFLSVSALLLLVGFALGSYLRRFEGVQKLCGGAWLAGAAWLLAA